MAIPDNLRRAINQLTITPNLMFWMALLFETKLVEVEEPPARVACDKSVRFTMATDFKHIYYSRKFVEGLPVPVVCFALAHELAHSMLLHQHRIYEHSLAGGWTPKQDSHGRMIQRNPTLWNIAGDYVINQMLNDSGFQIWKDCLFDPQYKGMTTEQVYNRLVKDAKAQGIDLDKLQQQLEKSLTGADLGEPSLDSNATADAEEMKDRIVRAAAVAKAQGHLPAGVDELIKEYTEPVYPVWLLLEQFVDQACRADEYSWAHPDPIYMNAGFIMPGPDGEQVSHVSLWYDTSGSVSSKDLSRFHKVGGDIIRNAHPAKLTVGGCDARVDREPIDVRSEGDWPQEVEITGRGGTSFKPPFFYLEERGESPSLLIYLTDLMGDFPDTPPQYPVLWISTTRDAKAPFGTTIYMGEE